MEKKYFFGTVIFLSIIMSLFTTIGTYIVNVFGLSINPFVGYVINFIVCYFIVLHACRQFWIHVFGACDKWINKNTRIFPKREAEEIEKNRKLQQTTA